MKKELFDFDDILIEPTVFSDINSRSEINPFNNDGTLPIFTAPMDTVITLTNYSIFKDVGINPVIPRTPDSTWISNEMFLSYSLIDFNKIFLENTPEIKGKVFVLIDVANGHMKSLYDSAKIAKIKYGNSMCLMVGNVANPKTFREYCKIGVDLVRVGIGNGNACLTSENTSIGYSLASLIKKCYKIKKNNKFNTKIVADGGFKKYSDIIKALGLGADYVMLGSILNKALESAGETQKKRNSTLGGWETVNQYSTETKEMFNVDTEFRKLFRGMSTKDVQKSWGKEKLTTSEGVVKYQKVEYTINGWVENFTDYLKSAMSYTGKRELHQFIGGVKFNKISLNSLNRYKK